ncbi:hypothetical protein ABH917_002200 [Thermobifida halotolerans]|uniref:hypothetical protein n=1 Tax=Thermobifida halotolerans TaxID=483545 RepID=UPI001FB41550|nr:hypothetical protein [Thermobifida halotolerans]
MARESLRDADPRQVGEFRLRARLARRPEGVVYAARDRSGEPVSVAVLSAGAATDPATVDRFRAAVIDGVGVPDRPRVLGSALSGAVVWVAVASERADAAEAFLAAAALPAAADGGGPRYAPHWAAAAAPSTARWAWPARAALRGAGTAGGSNRGLAAGVVALAALVVALLLVLYFFLADMSRQAYPAPDARPSPTDSPSPTPQGSPTPMPSPSPVEPTPRDGAPSPSPSSSPSEQPSPVPSVSVDPDDYENFPEGRPDPEDLL